MAQRFVDVLLPVALDQTYSYRVPDGMALGPGDVVDVPLGARTATGAVWAGDVAIKPGLHNRMKDVEEKLDIPPLKPELRRFVDYFRDRPVDRRHREQRRRPSMPMPWDQRGGVDE